MKATITKKGGYKCAPDGAVVRHYAEGDVVEGRAAEMALADKAAKAKRNTKSEAKDMGAAPENK